ncbi:MAG: NapC/NirT family cytochrome c [Gammaproteobacteria bacterium]
MRRGIAWSTLAGGVLVGVILWGGFNTALEATNSMEFCISCHEMRDNVYQEYRETVHFNNPTGVQEPRMFRKMLVSLLLSLAFVGYSGMIKAETTRTALVTGCHHFDAMDLEEQDRYAAKRHQRAIEEGETCIECHQGIAHKLPKEAE